MEALDKRIRSFLTDEQLTTYTNLKRLEDIVLYAAEELEISLSELVAVPEQDNWHYLNYGGNPVFTPASFVVSALRILGVFPDLDINASEFTVKDVYQLDIFDKEFEKSDLCIEADYRLPYC